MKLYKLKVIGNKENFNVEYMFSTNFIEYKDFDFAGSEQEKYEMFLEDLKANVGTQPINVKVKMTTMATDRAIAKAEILALKDVNDFIVRLGK